MSNDKLRKRLEDIGQWSTVSPMTLQVIRELRGRPFTKHHERMIRDDLYRHYSSSTVSHRIQQLHAELRILHIKMENDNAGANTDLPVLQRLV